jgi:hypothetical protein
MKTTMFYFLSDTLCWYPPVILSLVDYFTRTMRVYANSTVAAFIEA